MKGGSRLVGSLDGFDGTRGMAMRSLDGEFSALSRHLLGSTSDICLELLDFLTDKTLSREVFPAFWRPIMVTSISVALSIPDS